MMIEPQLVRIVLANASVRLGMGVLGPQNEKIQNSVKNEQGELVNSFTFPIAPVEGTNANGITYTRGVWEHVVNTQLPVLENSIGYADHTEGDENPSVKNAMMLWSNLRFAGDGSYVIADCKILESSEYGRTALEILRSGGEIKLSTVGVGELHNNAVIPNSYSVVSVADWVSIPAFNIAGSAANMREREADVLQSGTDMYNQVFKPDRSITIQSAVSAGGVITSMGAEEAIPVGHVPKANDTLAVAKEKQEELISKLATDSYGSPPLFTPKTKKYKKFNQATFSVG